MSFSKKNAEGYDDVTAFTALTNIARAEKMNGLAAAQMKTGKRKMKKVFICSRYRPDENHTVEEAVKSALFACGFAIDKGCVPVAPHLYIPRCLDDSVPSERSLGMAIGREFLAICDEVWQWGKTITAGMAEELAYAKKLGIPIKVYNTIGIPFNLWNSVRGYPDGSEAEQITAALGVPIAELLKNEE